MREMVFVPGMGWLLPDTIDNDIPILQMDIGFINRDGKMEVCQYGEHETLASDICFRNDWEEEALFSDHVLMSDFLVFEKGYVLVNRPAHEATSTWAKPLTKKQKDTLMMYTAAGFEERDLTSWNSMRR